MAEMSMREKLANALWSKWSDLADSEGYICCSDWSLMADAALDVLMEPTPDMIAAATSVYCTKTTFFSDEQDISREILLAGIVAAKSRG